MASNILNGFLFTLALLIAPYFSSSQRIIDPSLQQKIDSFVTNEYFVRANVTSLGLTIVQNDGEVFYSTGYGLADQERNIPIENSTQFLIGSITKSVTSLIVAKALHQKFPDLGEAVLDTPIRILMPNVNFTLNDRFRSEYTTFRDLVAHRECTYLSDLPTFAGSISTTEEITYAARYDEEFCGFRTAYKYNNRMYVMAGELAGILKGSSYDELVQNLLDDLGMTESAPGKMTDDYTQMPFRAMPYYMRGQNAIPFNTNLIKRLITANPAGGLFSTPNDMARYMRLHLNLGNLYGKQIVPREVMEWLRRPSNSVPLLAFKAHDEDKVTNVFGYGLGLHLDSYDGWEYINHAGYFSPYTSLMSLYPAKNLAIFATTNQGAAPYGAEHALLHSFIFEVLNGNRDPTETLQRVQRQLDTEREEQERERESDFEEILRITRKTKGTYKQDEILGKYASGSLGEAEISLKFNEDLNETQLHFDHGIWFNGWMEQVEEDTHFYRFHLDTDAIQNDYAIGLFESTRYIYIRDGVLNLMQLGNSGEAVNKFKFGLRMDQLPPIPWSPDSCGPDTF